MIIFAWFLSQKNPSNQNCQPRGKNLHAVFKLQEQLARHRGAGAARADAEGTKKNVFAIVTQTFKSPPATPPPPLMRPGHSGETMFKF